MATRLINPLENSSAEAMAQHSWSAINLNKNLRSYTVALPIPGYIGYIYLGDTIAQIADWYPLTSPPFAYYILPVDENGKSNYSDTANAIFVGTDIDVRNDPQFIQCSSNPNQTFWNQPYIFPPSQGEVWLSYVSPVVDYITGQFSACVSCDFTVTSLGDYLAQIKPTENTKTMLTDSSFHVIANSVGIFPFETNGTGSDITFAAEPYNATDLDDEALSSAAYHLPSVYATMQETGQTIVRTSFKLHGDKQLLLVRRIQLVNLDWFVVLVIPNSDFFGKIDIARKTTVWITATGLILSALKIIIDNRVWIAHVLHIKRIPPKGNGVLKVSSTIALKETESGLSSSQS